MKLPFFLFTLIFLIPSHQVCCSSQLAVNRGTDNTWDVRLSKHPTARRARLKPTWWPQGLAAPEAYGQWMGEAEWVWTVLQSPQPNAGGCYLGTSCPAQGASHTHTSSPPPVISASSWHQPFGPHMAIPYQARPFHIMQEGVSLHAGKVVD